jgi:ubiquinone/menaquinone biosynthesis C-methylase UbiE
MENPHRRPGYARMMRAYHRAFAPELRKIVRALPIRRGQEVLDMACGDGAYVPWLAECVGERGRVTAVDANAAYLEEAREDGAGAPCEVDFIRAAIEALPFADGRFDLCWCAQSFYSLPEPVEALRRMLRVTRPGGYVAVLESDTLHHVVLPLPVDVELAVRAAELGALAEQSGDPETFYVARNLRSIFLEAGLEDVALRTVAYDRSAPLGDDERTFLAEHIEDLWRRASGRLGGEARRRAKALLDPASPRFILRAPDLAVACIDKLALGRKPRPDRRRAD